jgi:hypothetical protein
MTIFSPATLLTGPDHLEAGQAAGSIAPNPDLIDLVDSAFGLFISTQTTSYTFALTDRGTIVQYNAAGAGTFTINSSVAFILGTVLHFRQIGAGQLTIAGAGSATVNTATSFTTRAQWSRGSAHLVATNTWVIDGDMT